MTVPQGEQEMWRHIANIDGHLNRIANCLEGFLKMAREAEAEEMDTCSQEGCENPTLLKINGQRWCQEHINQGFEQATTAISNAMADMENADRVRRGRD